VIALGAWFCIDCEESKKKNYEEKVHKVEDMLNNWRNKGLTLIGKIAVSKALAAPQLVYILSSTTSCSKSLKETNDLLFKFLWDNKGYKIKAGVNIKAVFWLCITFLTQISRSRFKQSRISMLIPHIYILGRFVNFLVIFLYIWR